MELKGSRKEPFAFFFITHYFMPEQQYVTEEGLAKLKAELSKLIAQRPIISEQIAVARDKGDISENAEYDAAKEAQGHLEAKIAVLQETIANAKVIDASRVDTSTVQMLNKVELLNLDTDAKITYTLVGESEANFREGKLAANTPIGKGLLGKKKGDVVNVTVPSGKVLKFKILNITL
jgi:transcription elongation factor GreA